MASRALSTGWNRIITQRRQARHGKADLNAEAQLFEISRFQVYLARISLVAWTGVSEAPGPAPATSLARCELMSGDEMVNCPAGAGRAELLPSAVENYGANELSIRRVSPEAGFP